MPNFTNCELSKVFQFDLFLEHQPTSGFQTQKFNDIVKCLKGTFLKLLFTHFMLSLSFPLANVKTNKLDWRRGTFMLSYFSCMSVSNKTFVIIRISF